MSASGTQSEYHPSRPDKRRRNRGILIAAIGAVVAALVFVGLAFATSNGDTKVRLGDDVFEVGEAKTLARRIDTGGPLLFQDLLVGGTRDIYVNHLGTNDKIGWVAFDARLPNSARACTLVWNPANREFDDPCTHATVPADGGELPHYPTKVTDEGLVVVDLTPGGLPGQGATTTGTSSTILITGQTTTTAG